MTDRELMQEALATFENYACTERWINARSLELMYALRDRLAQPDREWVGLTDGEIYVMREYPDCCEVSIQRAEAKLKEKNS